MSDAQKPVRNFTAAKAFIVYGGRILYLREAGSYIDGSQVGRYDISGGRLNPGEDVMDGLKREVMEETGLTLAEVFPFKEIDWRVDKGAEVWHIHAHFFVAVPSEPHVRLSVDHDDFQWVTPDAAVRTLPIMENFVPMMGELAERFPHLFPNQVQQGIVS
jgi:8-oxo-dGTP diphosphatase